MKNYKQFMVIAVILVIIAAAGAYLFQQNSTKQNTQTTVKTADKSTQQATAPAPMVEVAMPDKLSFKAKKGQQFFAQYCAVCHGENAGGQDGIAPPLIYQYYRPNHHADEAFYRAVKNGVQQHHWDFGNMPPLEVPEDEVALIIEFVRTLQKENGVF